MNPTITTVLIAFLFTMVAAAPQPNQGRLEDPDPILNVTTCGGDLDASSASIAFQLGGSIRADMRCVWIVRSPFSNQRFNLVASGLKESEGLYITPVSRAGLGISEKLSTIGQNVTIQSRSVMISLIVGHAPTFGFKMEFYSSGSSVTPDLTTHEVLTAAAGNVIYPQNGGHYGNNENALFPIAPSVPAQPTIRFTRVDLEYDTSCLYDSIRIYNWFEVDYVQVARLCGTTISTSVTFQDGAGVVLFSSDISNSGTGFHFQYQ